MTPAKPKRRVSFEEPPPARVQRYDWAKIREQLVARPNEWAKVFEDDLTSLVVAIRIGGIPVMRANAGIETRTTNNVRSTPRRCTLWLRYVPEKDTAEADAAREAERKANELNQEKENA